MHMKIIILKLCINVHSFLNLLPSATIIWAVPFTSGYYINAKKLLAKSNLETFTSMKKLVTIMVLFDKDDVCLGFFTVFELQVVIC